MANTVSLIDFSALPCTDVIAGIATYYTEDMKAENLFTGDAAGLPDGAANINSYNILFFLIRRCFIIS